MNRKGLTLLEIVLALGLAAMAISLLVELVAIGNRAANASRDESKAQMVAQSIMAELTSGLAEPTSTSGNWELDSTWAYDVSASMNASQTMYFITVTAKQEGEVSSPVSFTLTQWLAIPPEPMEEEDTSLEGGV